MILVNSNYTKVKAISVVIGTMGLFGGLEALLILTLRVCFNVLDELEIVFPFLSSLVWYRD